MKWLLVEQRFRDNFYLRENTTINKNYLNLFYEIIYVCKIRGYFRLDTNYTVNIFLFCLFCVQKRLFYHPKMLMKPLVTVEVEMYCPTLPSSLVMDLDSKWIDT